MRDADQATHGELRCQLSGCDYDMRRDDETKGAVYDYLYSLAQDVDKGRVRHVSISVHRAEGR